MIYGGYRVTITNTVSEAGEKGWEREAPRYEGLTSEWMVLLISSIMGLAVAARGWLFIKTTIGQAANPSVRASRTNGPAFAFVIGTKGPEVSVEERGSRGTKEEEKKVITPRTTKLVINKNREIRIGKNWKR